MKYNIRRLYRDVDKTEVIKTGLTLEEAQAHCSDPETSSSTCTNKEGLRRTAKYGPKMDTDNNWPEEAIDRILSLTTENARLKSEIKDLERKLRDIQLTLELSAENSGNWII